MDYLSRHTFSALGALGFLAGAFFLSSSPSFQLALTCGGAGHKLGSGQLTSIQPSKISCPRPGLLQDSDRPQQLREKHQPIRGRQTAAEKAGREACMQRL